MLLNKRIDFVSKSKNLGTIGAAVCALVLLVILPTTVQKRMAAARAAAAAAAKQDSQQHAVKMSSLSGDDVFPQLEKKQRDLLHEIMGLQDQVAKLTAQVKAINESSSRKSSSLASSSPNVNSETAEDRAFSVIAVRCGLDAFRTEVSSAIEKVAHLGEETKRSFQVALTTNRRHYLVKWHGLHGVDTSDPLYTEMDAESKFEKVGNFAKKLLLFQPGSGGGVWSVVRTFGGENWLSLMTNDGHIQKPKSDAARNNADKASSNRIPVV
ncbi:membrane-associated protein, putative [Bodo saltans]|uniref:Membrane-associated protein, putative n=1 Tax=Bodo saltans TaxID=75058 RepID=A0A0S4JHX4_BODSA|nr:membrane-associated protein, putative [Bodo saltans]|eukprot:CUG88845.1 membrane-associated protein, putative [Bodo saltans]